MAGTDGGGRRLVYSSLQSDISLFEIVFRNSLHLLQNVTNLKVGSGLCECALADVVNLFEVEDAMKDAFRFVQGLVANFSALGIKMVVELLEINEGDL